MSHDMMSSVLTLQILSAWMCICICLFLTLIDELVLIITK